MKIAVLAGGWSPEREVSLSSGTLIANALVGNGHRVALADVYRGVKIPAAGPDALFGTEPLPPHEVGDAQPDLAALRASVGDGDALIGPGIIALCRSADMTFLAMHGGMGENGQLQATLDSFGIRYTGSGYVGCLISMDKDLTKRLLSGAGIRVPDGVCFDAQTPIGQCCAVTLDKVGLPAVIKPCSCGSSVGVTIVENIGDLCDAFAAAQKYGCPVLAEKKIVGRELTVGILGDYALPVIEIVPPKDGFYDYRNKYSGRTVDLCPAPISPRATAAAQVAALAGMKALRLSGYARFDFIMDENELLYCLEANALPGMTPTSLLPLAAGQAGISYEELCEKILMSGMEK